MTEPTTARRAYEYSATLLRGLLARPLASYVLLISSAGLLLIIGLAMVFSATSVPAYAKGGNAYSVIAQQISAAVIGLAAFWICHRLPRRTFCAIAPTVVLVTLALLIITDGIALLYAAKALAAPQIGPIRSDALWLYIGPVQLQPSELAKFALVLWGADVLTRKGKRVVEWRELVMPLFPAVALLFVLVARGFGSKRIARDIIIAIVLAIVVFLIFTLALGLSLPKGPFGG